MAIKINDTDGWFLPINYDELLLNNKLEQNIDMDLDSMMPSQGAMGSMDRTTAMTSRRRGGSNNTNNYLYGGIGLVLLLGVYFKFIKKKDGDFERTLRSEKKEALDKKNNKKKEKK